MKKIIRTMSHKTQITKMICLFLLFLFFSMSGCKNPEEEIIPTKQPEFTQQAPEVTVPVEKEGGFSTMTEKELCAEAYTALLLTQTEWDSFLLKRTEKEAFVLVFPRNAKADKADSVADISMKTQDCVYLLAMEQRDGDIHKTVLTEYGISQIGIYSAEKETFAGVVYREQFAGWEEYGMKWYCFDETGSVIRVYGDTEKEDAYTYWKNRKPVLLADGTMELYGRKQETGSFEALVQEPDLKGYEDYTNYVAAYHWEKEQGLPVSDWLKDYVPYEAGDGLSGPELIREVFRAEKEGELPEPFYFGTGYASAVVTEYITLEKEIYFAIKKFGEAHQAGFQSLCIGSLDEEGKFRQCGLYPGDRAQTASLQTGTEAYILYCTETEYTGLLSAGGGLLQLKDGILTQKWSVTETGEPDVRYWEKRTARIRDGRMEIYTIEYNQVSGSDMVTGYERKLEEVKSFD